MKTADLPQLPQDAKELLETIGCLQVESLAAKDPASLCSELAKANKMLKVTSSNPELSDVEKWISSAAEELGIDIVAADPASELRDDEVAVKIDFKNNDKIDELLRRAPVAEKLKAHLVRSQNIAVSDIPKATLLNDCDGSVKIKTAQGLVSLSELTAKEETEEKKSSEIQPREGGRNSANSLKSKTKFNESAEFRDFESVNEGTHHIKPLDRGEREVINVNPELNKGVKMDSRRFIKGVLHPEPSRIKIPAFFVILFQLSLLINLIGVPYFLISGAEEKVNTGAVVSLLGALVVSFIFYLIFAGNSSCRVCGQKQFIPKQCIKHKKAHHVSFLGHMLPTALQAILYHWFYCIYCGTAIRLKK